MSRPVQPPAERGAPRPVDMRRDRERRVLIVGLAISLVVHLVAIAAVSRWLEPEPSPPPTAPPVVVAPPSGIRVVEIAAPAASPDVAPPDRPETDRSVPEPVPAAVAEAAPPAATGDTVVAADDLTAADRLAAQVNDPRLWRPMVLIPREPTLEDVEERVAAALELLSDSALAEADAAIRARDWTVDDGSGGKWGISPGKIHLGKLTLPLPIWFPEDPEAAAALRDWYAFERAIERTRILDSFEDRVRAIRERRERERGERRGAENGG